MFIDAHAHLLKEEYGGELDKVIKDSKEALLAVNNIAYNMETAEEVVLLADKYSLLCSVGVHPYEVDKVDETYLERLRTLADNKRVIAIGEIGLDYFRNITSFELQRKAFEKQLLLAKSLNMPFMVHSRNAFEDTIAIIKNINYFNGVFHSFDYGEKEAEEIINLGMYISFSGMLTFKKRENLRDVAKMVPIDKVLFETDAPYLAPVPMRGKKNLPIFVKYVYDKFSELRDINLDELQAKIAENFRRVFPKSKNFI